MPSCSEWTEIINRPSPSEVFGIWSPYIASHVREDKVIGSSKTIMLWVALFWASALATSMLTTRTSSRFHGPLLNFIPPVAVLLTYRIWRIDRMVMREHGTEKSQLRQILHIIIHAGVIYSLALFAAFISFLCRSNFQYGMVSRSMSLGETDSFLPLKTLLLTARSRPSSPSRFTWSSSVLAWPIRLNSR